MITELLERFQERSRLMGQMMHRLQIDVVGLARSRHGADFARVRSGCAACRCAQRCDLAHDDWLAGRPTDAPETYCPNAELLALFREREQRCDGANGEVRVQR